MFVKGFRGNCPSRIENGAVRISFPFDDLKGEVIVTTTDMRSISVFPVKAFERFSEGLERDPDQRRRLEIINFYACPQEIGADGKLPIPEVLGRFVGLDTDVAVLGHIDHITIIDAQRFADAIANEPAPDLF